MNRSMRGVLLAGAAVAVPAAVNALIASRAAGFEQPLPGDIGYYDWSYGRVAFYRMGRGMPLLLIHNPNAGGSAWEWRKVFPDLANHFTVYALDLLGYGLSDKPAMNYTGRLYADLIHDFLQDVIGERAHAAASALSSSYLVNAAVRRAESLDRLILVNPTGTTSQASLLVENAAYVSLRTPVLGTSLYYALVSRAAIERELVEHTYYDPKMVTPELVDMVYSAAHQPGSRYAAAAFMSGRLDLPLRVAFADIKLPVLIMAGREAYYTPLDEVGDLLFRHPQARLQVLDECGMLPHDEHAGEFLRLTRAFLAEPTTGEMVA